MRDSLRNASWIDLLIVRIEQLPVPAWLFYLALFLLFALLNMLVFRESSGTSTVQNLYSAFGITYTLALNDLMQRQAASSFDQFRPSLDLADGDIEPIRRRFLIAPAWMGLVFLLLGLQSGVSQVLEEISAAPYPVTFVMIALGFLGLAFTSILTLYFLANTIRRLAQIIQLHRRVDRVDLYHQDSLRAFSRFSSTTAFALLLTILVNSPWYIESAGDLEELIFYMFISLLSLVVFVVPLLGLRRKINAARDEKVSDIMADLDLIAGSISQAVRQGQLEKVESLKIGMDGLRLQRDELRKLHTWPWSTATIRAFWSAFLVPIILWLVTRILERFI